MALLSYDKNADSRDMEGIILNKISTINKKFKNKYGEMIICSDGSKGNWRRDIYPHYKKNRKTTKDKSSEDWDYIYGAFNKTIKDLKEQFQWMVLEVPMCEADDIIYIMATTSQEKTVIISRDSDFFQLLDDNIVQYDFVSKKIITYKTVIKNITL